MILSGLRWFSWWLFMVVGICLQGGLSGALLFPLVGSLLGVDYSLAEMSISGLKDGAFLALIWAPGTAFVVCLMRAHGKRPPAETNLA